MSGAVLSLSTRCVAAPIAGGKSHVHLASFAQTRSFSSLVLALMPHEEKKNKKDKNKNKYINVTLCMNVFDFLDACMITVHPASGLFDL